MTDFAKYHGGGSGGGVTPPAPGTQIAIGWYYKSSIVPSLADDGSFFTFPETINTPIKYTIKGGAVSWSCIPSDLNALCTKWIAPPWIDTANNLIWLFAIDANYDIYTATVNIATGVLTNVGSLTMATDWQSVWPQHAGIERPTMSAGNFTLQFGYGSARTSVVIDPADGTLISETTPTQSGHDLQSWFGQYTTGDGKIAVATYYSDNYGAKGFLLLMRGGMVAEVPLDISETGFACQAPLRFLPWGEDALCLGTFCITAYTVKGARLFSRAEIDRWITDVADKACLPLTT